MNTVHSVRDGDWSDPGTWDGPMTRQSKVVVNHEITIRTFRDIKGTPMEGTPYGRWLKSRYTRQEAIRAYRLFHPNRWNLKRAKWLARRAE